MRERVHKLLGEGAYPYVSTFHSLGLLIIKENFRLLGLKRKPSIYDRADSTRVIKDAIKVLNIDNEMEPQVGIGNDIAPKGAKGVIASEYAEGARTHRDRMVANIGSSTKRRWPTTARSTLTTCCCAPSDLLRT